MDICTYCGSPIVEGKGCPTCGAMLEAPHLPLGTRLNDGRYSSGRLLGQGGFGITYQGADLMLARPVAIKELFPDGSVRTSAHSLQPPHSLGTDGFRQALDSFINEARILARFSDPGIVRVLDVFEENQTAYLVMEYLEGEPLSSRITREGRLAPAAVLKIAQRVAHSLEKVHAANLLHRDIKPENLFCTRDDRIVLIDFGSARSFGRNQTVRQTRIVSEGYAPLEQYASQARFGPYTDLYALAATLHHALVGSPPPGANDRILGASLEPLPPSVPTGLREAVTRALALQVTERPQTVGGFLGLLAGSTTHPIPAAPRTPSAPAIPSDTHMVVLDSFGFNKIPVIKVVLEELGLGLKEAKDLVDTAPTILAEHLSAQAAEIMAFNLRSAGATARIIDSRDILLRTTDDSFTIMLDSPGTNKINVIKVVREVLGVGLKEAKDRVDATPVTLAEGLPAPTAEIVGHLLQEAGATVRVLSISGTLQKSSTPLDPIGGFSVVLQASSGLSINTMMTIKVIREVMSCSLEDAKGLLDRLPATIARGLSKTDALRMATHLKDKGVEFVILPYSPVNQIPW